MTKKNYIQPAIEVTNVQAMYTMVTESNPWGGPRPDTGDEIQY